MALINNAYGLIITGGLCGPACCALITAPIFGLVCGCSFEVVGGGGGYYPHPIVTPYYTPRRSPALETCFVLMDIRFGEQHWRKSYVVDKGKGDTIIKAITVFNKIKRALVSGVSKFQHAIKRTVAYFDRKDK